MTSRTWIAGCALGGLLVGLGQDLQADQRTINVAVERRTGEKMRGPATVTIERANVLRYQVLVGVGVTVTAGPDLRLPFIPPIAAIAAGEKTAAKPEVEKGASLTEKPTLASLLSDLAALEARRIKEVQQYIQQLIDDLTHAKRQVDALLTSSDGILQTPNGPVTLATSAASLAGKLSHVTKSRWPVAPVAAQLIQLAAIQAGLATIPASTLSAADKIAFDYISARLSTLSQWYGTVGPESEAAQRVGEAQGKLEAWAYILASITKEAFNLGPVRADCGFSFFGSKESKLELVMRDRLADPGAPETRQELVTVVCSSPMSVSAGFGRSRMSRHVPALVPSQVTTTTGGEDTTTAISRFGYSERSTHRTLPLILVNGRFWEPCDWMSLHLSGGAAVDAAGKVGTDIDYLIGLSVALKREMFVTLGYHFGHHERLNGFAEGERVPAGVSEAPTRRERDKAAVLAVTFRLR